MGNFWYVCIAGIVFEVRAGVNITREKEIDERVGRLRGSRRDGN